MSSSKFDNLRFPVHEVTENLIENLPELGRYSEFTDHTLRDHDKAIRYLVFLYDPASPLLKDYREIQERKDAALALAGFERTSGGGWPRHARELRELRKATAQRMLSRLFKIYRNEELMLLQALEEGFYSNIDELIKPVDIKVKDLKPGEIKNYYAALDLKKKLREDCMAMKDSIKSLRKEIFNEDGDALSAYLATSVTPEQIASMKVTKRAS